MRESQRTPAAWFREPPLARPACLQQLGPAAEESFDAADGYYFRSMARVQRLRAGPGPYTPFPFQLNLSPFLVEFCH